MSVAYLGPVGRMAERVAGLGPALEGTAMGLTTVLKPETVVRVSVNPSGRISIRFKGGVSAALHPEDYEPSAEESA